MHTWKALVKFNDTLANISFISVAIDTIENYVGIGLLCKTFVSIVPYRETEKLERYDETVHTW